MKNMRTITRRASVAGLLLASALTVLGASPSGATETFTTYKSSAWTIDHQYTYNLQDLAAARIARVGITPIPIP